MSRIPGGTPTKNLKRLSSKSPKKSSVEPVKKTLDFWDDEGDGGDVLQIGLGCTDRDFMKDVDTETARIESIQDFIRKLHMQP